MLDPIIIIGQGCQCNLWLLKIALLVNVLVVQVEPHRGSACLVGRWVGVKWGFGRVKSLFGYFSSCLFPRLVPLQTGFHTQN